MNRSVKDGLKKPPLLNILTFNRGGLLCQKVTGIKQKNKGELPGFSFEQIHGILSYRCYRRKQGREPGAMLALTDGRTSSLNRKRTYAGFPLAQRAVFFILFFIFGI